MEIQLQLIKRLKQIFRLLQINIILMRHTFTPRIVGERYRLLHFLTYLNPWHHFTNRHRSRGESIRIALESLGPIFVKFGQVLSTRRDLLPEDIADALEKLQDQVLPFPSAQAIQIIEGTLLKPIKELFLSFDETPLASASIAQVHSAILPNGDSVVIKILRPKIAAIIRQDIVLLYFVARLTERFWAHGKRLRPLELVAEFERTIMDELDLLHEAANASQLRRNFQFSPIMYVPKIYWDYAHKNLMVMERIHGIRISNIHQLKEQQCNMKKLAENGVEIFFTQVFRDNFFHADMHPGNLFVDATNPENPRYLGVDFGIMGSLSPSDQHYLAKNLLAFFRRNYREVATLHVESGWVPATTRIDQFEAAIRTVCEPIFEKPLQDISFGYLLLRLFTTAERFNMEIQPQLMLLQKTLLNIEGLGRQLYPQLDLWKTAKPFMERWIKEQRSIGKLAKLAIQDWPEISEKLIKSPQLIFSILENIHYSQRLPLNTIKIDTIKTNILTFYFGAGSMILFLAIINMASKHPWFAINAWWPWACGMGLFFWGWLTKRLR